MMTAPKKLTTAAPSFLVIDGYLLNPVNQFVNNLPRMNVGRVIFLASSAAQTLAWRRKVDRVTNDPVKHQPDLTNGYKRFPLPFPAAAIILFSLGLQSSYH